jgi:hypothetical protein
VTFGRLAASTLVLLLPALVVNQVILAAIPGVAGVILSHVSDFLTLPYGMITTALLFFDLKSRRDGQSLTTG